MTTKTTKDETMNDYLIINEAVNSEHFEKSFKDVSEAKNWIINHLDTSKEWQILPATKKNKDELELKSAIEHMQNTFKKGDTIYTQLIKCTPNGTVYFRLRYIKDNRPYQCTYHYSKIMDHKLDEKNSYSIKFPFGNMDMGFHAVYSLCRTIWNDGYYLKHEWL